MSANTSREEAIEAYLAHMIARNMAMPPETLEDACMQFTVDAAVVIAAEESRYFNGRNHKVPKAGNLHLAWEYLKDPNDHQRFLNMLRIPPLSFHTLLNLIEHHTIFQSGESNNSQAPVKFQLAVTLYRMGRCGNSASLEDTARMAGISTGSVENYTSRCLIAIESLHDQFIRKLLPEEKEREKEWLDAQVGFRGGWRDGWVMYDGTIVVLFQKPGTEGDTYYTRKGNYGLNVQIGNIPSNLCIVDYSYGMTGAAHDAAAFEYTTAKQHPEWFFEGKEFAWTDSAYPCNERTIPVHKEPASREPRNAIFDKYVSHIRVRSEHCMGALKGRFQCLRGLRVAIDSKEAHYRSLRGIKCAIILHNLVIDVEGSSSADYFQQLDAMINDRINGTDEGNEAGVAEDGETKQQRLIDELMEYREERDRNL